MNEKMIEEIRGIMCGEDCEECAKEMADFCGITLEQARNQRCIFRDYCQKLYNAGCLKIPEGSVLTIEEVGEFGKDSAEVKFSRNSKWIPCSERLPEKAGEYLVTGAWWEEPAKIWICECVVIAGISGWANNARNPIVAAWMPLPEPYKSN